VIERFVGAGVSEGQIAFERDTYTFNCAGTPPELLAEFDRTSIAATFLRVTVSV
jgi:hypothetical protein